MQQNTLNPIAGTSSSVEIKLLIIISTVLSGIASYGRGSRAMCKKKSPKKSPVSYEAQSLSSECIVQRYDVTNPKIPPSFS